MREPGEEWRPVPGFQGLYEVSSHGRIYSVERMSNGGRNRIQARIMKTHLRHGAVMVRLRRLGAYHIRVVHRLVLEAFRGPCPKGKEGCHNDGNPTNNRLENLRWDTHKANCADRVLHGTAARGERCGQSKLKESDVLTIRAAHASGETVRSISDRTGVPASTVRHIVNRYSWRHLPDSQPQVLP